MENSVTKKRNQKIVKFHKASHLNIGVIVFIIIFIYMLYNIFQYFTADQVAAYEVSQGTIAQNNTFTGLALREETVYYAESSGYINYFNKDATKAGVGTYVYSIDETGDFYNKVVTDNGGQLFEQRESYQELEKTASEYVLGYSDESFYQVYSFKYDMEAALMEALSASNLSSLDGYNGNSAAFHSYLAPQAGVVVYNTDGLENTTVDTFDKDSFDESKHVKNSLQARERVNAGDPVYKLITGEQWHLVLPIDETLAVDLAEENNIKVEFQKDGSSAWGSAKIINRDDAFYLDLSFQNSMIRFAADRYLEVKLLLSDTSGLKIPNTALTEKSFFVVPKDYVTKGGDSDGNGVLRQSVSKDGKKTMEFTSVTVFQETEDTYYIDGSDLKKGDVINKPDSGETMTLEATASLQGVYNINKGYAVFRKVEILFQNEEYTIVNTGTSYGLSLYDYIALDASAIKENQIVH